jgi:hypothetical protein
LAEPQNVEGWFEVMRADYLLAETLPEINLRILSSGNH